MDWRTGQAGARFNAEDIHETMLHFFPPGMAERYWLFCFVAVLGVLQLIAAHFRWVGLSIPGQRLRSWGYGLGAGLLSGAYLWFFGTGQALIFQPGLAGAELFAVFAAATLAAIAVTYALVSVVHRPSVPRPEIVGERVTLHPGAGTLIYPSAGGPVPAVIIVSGLPDNDFPMLTLSRSLVNQGALILSMDLARDGPIDYPDVLARVPAACAYLHARPDVDDQGIALIGAGVGGDLALRIAATDPSIRGVVAIDPVLNPAPPGQDLLQRETLAQAMRWDGLRRRLASALIAAERVPQTQGRPALILFRSNRVPDGGSITNKAEVEIVDNTSEAVQRIVRWAATVMDERNHVP